MFYVMLMQMVMFCIQYFCLFLILYPSVLAFVWIVIIDELFVHKKGVKVHQIGLLFLY